jgi:hypothetical protein
MPRLFCLQALDLCGLNAVDEPTDNPEFRTHD